MIIPKARISSADVDALISCASIDDSYSFSSAETEAHDVSLTPDSFDYDYTYAKTVPAPSDSLIEKFNSHSSDLYNAACSVRSSRKVVSRYDINWTSIEDYTMHWNLLDKESQVSIRSLVLSDHANANRFGLKKRNLESHLLLHIGCDMDNIVNNGGESVRSNLKSPDPKSPNKGYSRSCLHNRTVDAKTALRAYKKFDKEFSPAHLFKLGFVAYQAVITPKNSLALDIDPHKTKEAIHSFFRKNTEFLSKLANKRRKIMSYAYSHEISVDSILDSVYRPHTHVLFFVKADRYAIEESQRFVESLEESINLELADRNWSTHKLSVDGEMLPSVARKYSEIERSFEYFHRAYSLADQYMREIREDNVRELNKATVEAYRNLIWFFRGEEGGAGRRGIARFRSSHIPRKDETSNYLHPLLSKAKKTTTIKKEKLKVKNYAHSVAASTVVEPSILEAKNTLPSYAKTERRASRAGKICIASRVSELLAPRTTQAGTRAWRRLPIQQRKNRRDHQQCRELREGCTGRGSVCLGRNRRRLAQRGSRSRLH